MILGLDVSHYQQGLNFPAVKASGRDFVVIKATEGVGYLDPSFALFRQQAHAAGLIVGIYHFGRDNPPAAEAAYFTGAVGDLRPGEFLVLDQEVTHSIGNVAWCAAWLNAVTSRYGINPLIYMNTGSTTGVGSGDWSRIAQSHGLWLAKYDQSPAVQNAVPCWGGPAMKQYSDAGSVPGCPGGVDVDSFFGTRDQLLAYGKPSPTPGGFLMALTDAQQLELLADATEIRRMLGVLLGWPGASTPAEQAAAGMPTAIAEIHDKVRGAYTVSGHPDSDSDDLLGHVLSLRAKVAAPVPVTVDAAGFLTALKGDPAAMQALGAAVAPSVAAAVIALLGAHLTTPPAA